RLARSHPLPRCACATVMHNRTSAWQHFAVRRILKRRNSFGQRQRQHVARMANEHQRSSSEDSRRLDRIAIEIVRHPNRRGTKSENDRRRAALEKIDQPIRDFLFTKEIAAIIKWAASYDGICRPVGLWRCQKLRKQREYLGRRVLAVKYRL